MTVLHRERASGSERLPVISGDETEKEVAGCEVFLAEEQVHPSLDEIFHQIDAAHKRGDEALRHLHPAHGRGWR